MKIPCSFCEDYTYFTMEPVEFSEASLAKQRLSSFRGSPSQNNHNIHLSNSPIKLAEAGFERPVDAVSDEVFCKYCGLRFSGWEGEPPLATHRILRPNCPFLNPPAPSSDSDSCSHSEQSLPHSQSHNDHNSSLSPLPSSFSSSTFIKDMLSANSNVRRQLFSNATSSQSSSSSPKLFRPKHRLGFLALFESHRLLTFLNPFSYEAAIYAKCGFVYNCTLSRVTCVFCNVELDEMMSTTNCSEIRVEMLHESKVPTCPFVCGSVDVGNISRELERSVRDKVRNNTFCCSMDHIDGCCSNRDLLIKHPEFEDFASRVGTFQSWPMLLCEQFPVDTMVQCGFYYTGLMDSVRCYCCGVGLRNWSKGADPFLQHARASQFCLHMLQVKGREFINDAQDVELTVEADYGEVTCAQDSDNESDSGISTSSTCSSPSSTFSSSSFSSSSSSLSSSSIGSPHLNLETIKAATCQYTIEQIADAVLKFFISSWGQYPNEQLLLGTLKAADENHKQICLQREEIITKDSQLQSTKSQLQEHKTVIQVKDTQLQAKDTQLQAKDRVIEVKDHVIQAKERELAQTRQSLHHQVRGDLEQLLEQKDEIIEHNKEQLVQKDEQLEHNREQLVQKDGIIVEKDGIIEHKDEQLEEKDLQLLLKAREVEDLRRHNQSLMEELRRREMALHSQQHGGGGPWNHPPPPPIPDTNPDGFPVARCTVCYSNPSQIVFQPCGHLCCCDQCASKLSGKKCPICRGSYVTVDKVYVM